jgi:chlorobactene glucosyltransferase
MAALIVLALLTGAALVVMLVLALWNALVFPRLRAGQKRNAPLVSVLIPARNEADVIGATVMRLLAQNTSRFEVLVLDDNSTDSTAEIARQAANGDARLKVLSGAPLPPGWLGKNWACAQLAEAATGDWLVFTDADVRWEPNALNALIAEAKVSEADVATVWPTQITQSWGERLVVPLMAMVILAYLPATLVHRTRWAAFAAANGQCLAFRRRAYEAIGGHAAVRASIVEDIALARLAKQRGFRLRMIDGAGLVACRMYTDWAAVRAGYAKNIIAGYGDRVVFLALATVFHWLVFLWPWVWLALGWAFPALAGWPTVPLLLVALGVAVRAFTAAITRQRVADALLMPVSVLAMTVIAAQAVWWRWHGGPQWKGRTLAQGGSEREPHPQPLSTTKSGS